MHYVVLSECGGCSDTSTLEITESCWQRSHGCCFSTHLLHGRRSEYESSAELDGAAHVQPGSHHPEFPGAMAHSTELGPHVWLEMGKVTQSTRATARCGAVLG